MSRGNIGSVKNHISCVEDGAVGQDNSRERHILTKQNFPAKKQNKI